MGFNFKFPYSPHKVEYCNFIHFDPNNFTQKIALAEPHQCWQLKQLHSFICWLFRHKYPNVTVKVLRRFVCYLCLQVMKCIVEALADVLSRPHPMPVSQECLVTLKTGNLLPNDIIFTVFYWFLIVFTYKHFSNVDIFRGCNWLFFFFKLSINLPIILWIMKFYEIFEKYSTISQSLKRYNQTACYDWTIPKPKYIQVIYLNISHKKNSI